MQVYVIATALSLAFAGLARVRIVVGENLIENQNVIPKKVFAFLSFLPLTFVMAVRRGVGTDYWSYSRWFYGTRESLEPGFALLNTVLRTLFDNPQSIFIVCAVIICGAYFIAIWRESLNPVYSILLFVICKDYFMAMNGMRQYLAGAIMLFAIPYIKEKKWLPTLLIMLLASLFHRSVIIFAVFCLLYALPMRPIIVTVIFFGALAFSYAFRPLVLNILQKLGLYTQYFSMLGYRNTQQDVYIKYIMIFAAFFILLWYEYKAVERSKNLKMMYTAVTISLLMLSIGGIMPTNFHRLTWYMDAFIAIYTPEAIRSFGGGRSKVLKFLLAFAIAALYSVITITDLLNGNQDVLPYRTMWS